MAIAHPHARLSLSGLGWGFSTALVVLFVLCMLAALFLPMRAAHGWVALFSDAPLGSPRLWIEGLIWSAVAGWLMRPTLFSPCKIAYIAGMKTKRLTDVLERVENWPAEWQEQLADIALDIDAGLKGGVYYPTPEELEGIDRGLRDAEQGRFATEEEVEQAFAKFRGA